MVKDSPFGEYPTLETGIGLLGSLGEALAFAQALKEEGVHYSFLRRLNEAKE